MKQNIIVVEDDGDIARLVQHHLAHAGYAVQLFSRIAGVVREAENLPPALFLLDIMVPGGDGFDLCRQIRQNAPLSSTPVIFLTARTGETDRVAGFDLGADDYITKPFSTRELVARVKAVLRRFERPLTPALMKLGDIEINTGGMTLAVRGKLVQTTATEFRLLDYFARHPDQVFSRDQLIDAVWRENQFVTSRSVDVYVRKLREKIERDPETPRYLKTIRGAGYRFGIPQMLSGSEESGEGDS
jgi:DNA-binding response OmpR family regulator